MIRPAKLGEMTDIIAITRACAAHMITNNIFQWNDSYPSMGIFQNDIEKGELFVLEIDARIIGTIVISTHMDQEYIPVQWLTPSQKNIYIHRLAVHPDHQKKGYAQELMTFAEDYGRKNNYTSIRLDTFSQNKRNQQFYEQRGYQKLDDIYFPKQSDAPFHCYELVL
ncbi:GNAT family N-acetyltransferase [Sediminicola sp. 1XM1-17]|uniref:GNAT family N-acetyltransferase n=1 Tax=Sediminicola sp. 1XM1-17 TaxID=3127702 RepID=UPI0030775BF7